jgi:pimeloyl-ACP methyl ester carboxylesterase
METSVSTALSHDFETDTRVVEIDGRKINYVEVGEKSGPVLLYVHGLMGTWRNWIFNLLPFADRFHVIAVDLPGFGDSEMPVGEFSIERYAETLKRFIDALGLGSVTMVGNSMGGQIAAVFAKRSPELLDRLVLVDPAGFSTCSRRMQRLAPLAFLLNWTMLLLARIRRGIASNRWLAAAATKIVIHKPMQISGEAVLLLLEGLGKAGFLPAIRTITHTPVAPYPGTIETPTTIIWGRKDLLIPLSDAHRFAAMIPHARLELLEEIGHIPMFETPEIFNPLIETVLEEQVTPDSRSSVRSARS